MTAPHFFVDALEAGTVELSVEDSRHALRALRLRAGEEISLADGRGTVALGAFMGDRDGLAMVRVAETRRVLRRGTIVSVALAPPKGDRLAWAIQKLAELGVDEVLLVETERSVRAWPKDRVERALERQRMVAREAAMQARLHFVMEIRAAEGPLASLGPSNIRTVMLSEGSADRLGTALLDRAPAVRLLIGPEGGFTEREVQSVRDAGAAVASLGPGILRSETAAVVGAALVLARYGRLG
jgi:16S rRNA (uracil1498-N3)-methyltransferase